MSEPFVGEIRPFAGTFAPRNWHFCDGALLPISQYDVLFSLLGTNFGGDGRNTFALPDLLGRVAIGEGQGPGLSHRPLGQKMGAETVTLSSTQLPNHSHEFVASTSASNTASANGAYFGATGADTIYHNEASSAGSAEVMAPNTVGNTGGNRSHDNVMPSLATNYIISLFGIYPSRN